jgi:23S rRNA (uracil1939-C5)-methyltransferase
LLDPPRDGLKVREPLLANWKELTWVFYISCNPATWARDVKDFTEKGFTLLEVTPIDLFPQTPHLEIMSVLHRA